MSPFRETGVDHLGNPVVTPGTGGVPASFRPTDSCASRDHQLPDLHAVHHQRVASRPVGPAGPFEEAVVNTPILEEISRSSRFTSIEHVARYPQLRSMHAVHHARKHGTRHDQARGRAVRVHIAAARTERQRHRRKYAEGELGPDRSFYFRGPDGKLNLPARNLVQFVELVEGIDDETWLHHRRQGDYSRWFSRCIKDEDLASQAAGVEKTATTSGPESGQLILAAVQERYFLPS